mmetsp:Transcript_3859/g.10472  ORF Transcript_3859/g.10472 Transcript_3859/m.10472 type:complete len:239 (-) Transcript_3859:1392-2108(-)
MGRRERRRTPTARASMKRVWGRRKMMVSRVRDRSRESKKRKGRRAVMRGKGPAVGAQLLRVLLKAKAWSSRKWSCRSCRAAAAAESSSSSSRKRDGRVMWSNIQQEQSRCSSSSSPSTSNSSSQSSATTNPTMVWTASSKGKTSTQLPTLNIPRFTHNAQGIQKVHARTAVPIARCPRHRHHKLTFHIMNDLPLSPKQLAPMPAKLVTASTKSYTPSHPMHPAPLIPPPHRPPQQALR